MRLSRLKSCCLATGAVGTALTSLATYAQTVPSPADASRIRPNETARPTRDSAPVDGVAAQPAPHVTAVPAGAERITLTVRSILIDGNSAIETSDLEPIYAPLIGKKVSVAQLYELADALTKLYRERGFAFSFVTIPPQELDRVADVKLHVVEGYVETVKITGDVPDSVKAKARTYAAKLLQQRPISTQLMERQLLLINDLPGVMAESTLVPAKAADGAIAMDIQLRFRPFQARAGVDNFGNHYIGPARGYGALQWNASSLLADSVQVTGMTTADGYELRNGEFLFDKTLGSDGLRVQASVSHTSTHPSLRGVAALLAPEGSAQIVRLNGFYPIVRSRSINWLVGAEFNATDTSTHFSRGFETLETSDHIRSLRLSTSFSQRDAWSGYNSLQLEFSKGLNALGASEKGDPTLSRTRGNPQYTKWVLNASRVQHLGSNFGALVAVSGQHSPSALLTAEEFGVGGYQFGRGFDSSEITGDRGVAAKVELSYFPPVTSEFLSDPSLFLFYDGGATWDKDPGAGQHVRQSLTSAGVGARAYALDQLRTELYLARPMTNKVASRLGEKQDDWRAMVNVYVEY